MDDNDYVMAFDHFYTTNHIQILKSLLPFMDNDNFRMLPVLIKYMELKYTLSMIGKGNTGLSGGIHASSIDAEPKAVDPSENLEKYTRQYTGISPPARKKF